MAPLCGWGWGSEFVGYVFDARACHTEIIAGLLIRHVQEIPRGGQGLGNNRPLRQRFFLSFKFGHYTPSKTLVNLPY